MSPPSGSRSLPAPQDAPGGGERTTVLVTGGGGFVGSAVVRGLVGSMGAGSDRPILPDGQPVGRVVALVSPSASSERLEDLSRSDRWELVRCDPTDAASLGAVLRRVRPRAVLHVAMDPSAHGPLSEAEQVRVIDRPLEVLVRALEGVPGTRIVTTGSVAVIRPGPSLDEGAPIELNPSYLEYARHKLREEQCVERLGTLTGVSWIHLRLFYIFGRYERPSRLLPHLVRELALGRPVDLSLGKQVRDYTDVDEVAGAYRDSLAAPEKASRRIYHIGSGRGISVRDFARTVAEVVGRPELLRFGAVRTPDEGHPSIVANPALARAALGWAPSGATEELIRVAARWWARRTGGSGAATS